MVEQEARERGILAISYPLGTIPSDPSESGVRMISRGSETRIWDIYPVAQMNNAPAAPPTPSISELLGKINPSLLVPAQGPSYPYSNLDTAAQSFSYNNYPEPQPTPPQSGWGQPVPYPPEHPNWGAPNIYQRNPDRGEYGRDDRGGPRGTFKRNVKPGARTKTQVCRFWLKNE